MAHFSVARRIFAEFAAAMTASIAMLVAVPSFAQHFPSRTVRMIVPSAAGGGFDVLARILSPKLSELWAQPVIVENRPGANFTIGTNHVAKSAPDGYTLLFVNTGAITIAPAVYPNLPYVPLRELVPITLWSFSPLVLLVSSTIPASSVRELLAQLRANSGKLNHAATNSAVILLASELFKALAGVDYVEVNYKGSVQAVTSLMPGESQFSIIDPITAQGAQRSGKVRALAVTSAERYRLQPDLPTIAEAGLPGYAATTWGLIMAPASTPPEVVARLNADMVRALTSSEIRAKFEAVGADIMSSSVDEAMRVLRADTEKWAKLVKERNIKLQD